MRRFASLTAGANSGSSCWRAACSDVPDCGGRENGCILNTIAVKVINSKLITRLSSWFSIHGSVLSWFKSYLSSRSFHVKCHDNLSFFHTSSCGVPQGSVLGPLLFVMYTTPLSTLSLLFPSTTTFTQMILSSSLFTHSTSTQAFLTFKTLFNASLPG